MTNAFEVNTRWVALMIQLGKFVGGWVVGWWGEVADTIYLYPDHWGWINKNTIFITVCF